MLSSIWFSICLKKMDRKVFWWKYDDRFKQKWDGILCYLLCKWFWRDEKKSAHLRFLQYLLVFVKIMHLQWGILVIVCFLFALQMFRWLFIFSLGTFPSDLSELKRVPSPFAGDLCVQCRNSDAKHWNEPPNTQQVNVFFPSSNES